MKPGTAWKLVGGVPQGVAAEVGATAAATITGLRNGTAYSFIVTPKTSKGTGVPSVSASATPVNAQPVTVTTYKLDGLANGTATFHGSAVQ